MSGAKVWRWRERGGRCHVYSLLAPAYLWSPSTGGGRGMWLAPPDYRDVWKELTGGLCSATKPIDRTRAVALLDQLFLELARGEEATKKAGNYVPPDVEQAWAAAAAAILEVKALIESTTPV